ncbi:response regulator [Rhodobacterales bacterium HKCCE3408]|nr:response regulator [Rhodobacterales bacterium HKCCE3408]
MQTTALQINTPLPAEMTARQMNLLILDDNEIDRQRLKRISEKAGLRFTCFEAHDLESFRAQLDAHPMDLVFLDYQLEVDNGLDALRMLVTHEKQAQALPIMITSIARHDVAVAAMRGGCADFVTKEELGIEQIQRTVAGAIERRIIVTSMNNAHVAQDAMRSSLARIARTSGSDVARLLITTIRKLRGLRGAGALDPSMTDSLDSLEATCSDLHGLLSEVDGIVRPTPDGDAGRRG